MNELLKIAKKNPIALIAGLLIGVGIYYLINYVYTLAQ